MGKFEAGTFLHSHGRLLPAERMVFMNSSFVRLCGWLAILVLPLGMAAGARADTFTVQVKNFVFDPADLTITVGDTVVWTWANGTHSTTSDDCPCCVCLWDSGVNPT